MKILRLKLVNFIGIMHGLETDTIEIDFTKGNNKIVMLRGGNGSGKSTIMSQLHPYKESFDERKKLILDGCDGLKEIDIEHNGHKYEISHTYTKTAQSFIKKDGVELNKNGGVKTFEDIVSKELGITKDFFQIGKIGSNTKNFVDLPAVDRKAYIGNFLNIEDILEAHTNANEKLKLLKKDIDVVANELKKYNSKDIIETEISRLETSLAELDTRLNELYTQQGSLQTTIDKDNETINGRDPSAIQATLSEKQVDYQKYKDIKDSLESELTELSNPAEYSEKLAEEIQQLQSDIRINSINISNKNLLAVDTENKISSTKLELEALGNPEDIARLADDIAELETKINTLKESIKANSLSKTINEMIKSRKDVSRMLGKFIDFSDFIEKYYKELGQTTFANNKTNIEYFFDEDFKDSFNRQIHDSKIVIESKQKLLETQQKEKGIKEGYVCQLKNLEKRPAECNIDDCPFIKDALEHKNILSEIDEKDKEIIQTKKDLDELSIKADNLQTLQSLYQNFQEAYKNVLPRENDIYIEFIKDKSLSEWLTSSLSEFQSARQKLIDDANNAINDINEYRITNTKLNTSKETKKKLEDSDLTVRKKYLDDIAEAEEKLKGYNAEIETLTENGKCLADDLSKKLNLKGKYDSLIQARSKVDSNSTMISTKKSELESLQKVLEELSAAETSLANVKDEINTKSQLKASQSNELVSAKMALNNVDSLSKRKEKLDAEYNPVSTIVKALAPKSGIPLIFINSYLAETQAIANDLLNIAFNGEFQINFVTGEREFNIQVISKNNVKPDIKMASQGEVAITTISISLALIEQSIGDYNILCLDEIDGPLDPKNRGNFIDILNSQINKLGIEQVFVISHNDAFDTAAMDLVLLRDNDVNKDNTTFMANKTIIFE